MQKSNPSSNDRVSVENGTYSTMEHNDETWMRVSKIHKFEIIPPVPWPLEEFVPKFTEPKSPVNTVPLEFCTQDLVAKFTKKSPIFQSQNCPSTRKFAHHFAKVVRYFLIHGRFETSICLLHVGRSGLQSGRKKGTCMKLWEKRLVRLQDFYIAYVRTYIDIYIDIYTQIIYTYIVSNRCMYYITGEYIYVQKNRNMKLFYKVLYHDGQWSLSTIGKDYLAVEMASIMVHLTSRTLNQQPYPPTNCGLILRENERTAEQVLLNLQD